MKVVTINSFGEGPELFHGDRIYVGDAWLFRFVASPDHFFGAELPHVEEVLGIDIRQIYQLALYGEPGQGLSDVCMYVSFLPFQEPPVEMEKIEEFGVDGSIPRKASKLHLLQDEVASAPPSDFPDDILSRLFADLLGSGSPPVKRKLARALEQEERSVAKKGTGK
jgi:hypothetical protein